MIVTLTLNPSLDRTVEVETLARGEVMRALGVRVDPGGKGINVSRALAAHGLPTRAVVTVGGAEGEQLVALLRDTGNRDRAGPDPRVRSGRTSPSSSPTARPPSSTSRAPS